MQACICVATNVIKCVDSCASFWIPDLWRHKMIDYEMLCIFGLIVCNGMQLATIWTLQKRLGYHVEY